MERQLTAVFMGDNRHGGLLIAMPANTEGTAGPNAAEEDGEGQ